MSTNQIIVYRESVLKTGYVWYPLTESYVKTGIKPNSSVMHEENQPREVRTVF